MDQRANGYWWQRIKHGDISGGANAGLVLQSIDLSVQINIPANDQNNNITSWSLDMLINTGYVTGQPAVSGGFENTAYPLMAGGNPSLSPPAYPVGFGQNPVSPAATSIFGTFSANFPMFSLNDAGETVYWYEMGCLNDWVIEFVLTATSTDSNYTTAHLFGGGATILQMNLNFVEGQISPGPPYGVGDPGTLEPEDPPCNNQPFVPTGDVVSAPFTWDHTHNLIPYPLFSGSLWLNADARRHHV